MFNSELRLMSTVRRWSIVRHLHPQSVADHSYFVTVYALEIAELIRWGDAESRLQLVKAALAHDAHEIFTGDQPSPFKALLSMSTVMPYVRLHMMRALPSIHQWEISDLTRPELVIVKAADLTDTLFYLAEENALGNKLGTWNDDTTIMGWVMRKFDRAWDQLPATSGVRDHGRMEVLAQISKCQNGETDNILGWSPVTGEDTMRPQGDTQPHETQSVVATSV